MTDNRPQFTSAEFLNFGLEWDFKHTTSSLTYTQSNGQADSKNKLLKKTGDSDRNIYLDLLVYKKQDQSITRSNVNEETPEELLICAQCLAGTSSSGSETTTRSVESTSKPAKVLLWQRY